MEDDNNYDEYNNQEDNQNQEQDYNPNDEYYNDYDQHEQQPEDEKRLYIAETIETKTHIEYIIKGNRLTSDLNRRFSDFFLLREILASNWPGLLIPMIPSKTYFTSSKSKSTIELRKRLLGNFCWKLTENQHLMESEEVKTFLNPSISSADLRIKLKSIPKPNYAQILEKYKVYFFRELNDFNNISLSKEDKDFLIKFADDWLELMYIKKETFYLYSLESRSIISNTYKLFNEFENYEKTTAVDFATTDSDYDTFIFFNSQKHNLTTKINTFKESMKNPYNLLFQWFEEKELDFLVLKQSLSSYTKMEKDLTALEKDIKALTEKIKKLEDGKRSFFDVITFKSKEESLTTATSELNTKNEEHEALTSVLQIVSCKLANEKSYYVDSIKHSLYSLIKEFANSKIHNSRVKQDVWAEAQ